VGSLGGSHRKSAATGDVFPIKTFKVQIRQHVTIHQDKVFGKILDQPQRPDRAQGAGLKRVVDPHTPFFSVLKKRLNEVRLMINR
jgi:hypothetical protein